MADWQNIQAGIRAPVYFCDPCSPSTTTHQRKHQRHAPQMAAQRNQPQHRPNPPLPHREPHQPHAQTTPPMARPTHPLPSTNERPPLELALLASMPRTRILTENQRGLVAPKTRHQRRTRPYNRHIAGRGRLDGNTHLGTRRRHHRSRPCRGDRTQPIAWPGRDLQILVTLQLAVAPGSLARIAACQLERKPSHCCRVYI